MKRTRFHTGLCVFGEAGKCSIIIFIIINNLCVEIRATRAFFRVRRFFSTRGFRR
jgi:hypothetical protein